MRVLRGRVFWSVLDTLFLTPDYDPQAPDTLVRVTERYKVRGAVLKATGYDIADDKLQADDWFQRVWDTGAETWFIPQPVTEQDKPPVVDLARTVTHGLGFVPMVWIRNLPGGTDPDG